MPNATVRANARTLPEATLHSNAEVQALAAEFEAAYAEHALVNGAHRTNEEIEAADERMREIAAKFAALPSTDISMLKLKARVYLWAEGADLENFDTGDVVSGPVLASLFRDLGADHAIGGSPALSAIDREVIDLWQRRQQMVAAFNSETTDEEGEAYCDVQAEIDKHLGASVLALAAVLMVAIHDKGAEEVSGMNRASLAAIRPQLTGAIAEAADRLLAQKEEEAA